MIVRRFIGLALILMVAFLTVKDFYGYEIITISALPMILYGLILVINPLFPEEIYQEITDPVFNRIDEIEKKRQHLKGDK